MKKALKIFGITLGCIILLLAIVIGSALWVVFTPERLTPIVRNVASEYVKCEHHIGQVELTFFSTFPHFGLAIDSLTVVNPVEGAPSDTVLSVSHAVTSVDVMALLNEHTLSIPTLRVPDMQANIYIAADGTANYDVLALPSDTTAEDTTTMTLPFEQIKVGELAISAKSLGYESLPDSIRHTRAYIYHRQHSQLGRYTGHSPRRGYCCHNRQYHLRTRSKLRGTYTCRRGFGTHAC